MQVHSSWNDGFLKLVFEVQSPGNLVDAAGKSMRRFEANFEIDSQVAIGLHPDQLGLAALLCVGPYARKILLDWGVSDEFSWAVKTSLGVEIGPARSDVPKRRTMHNSRPGLAFSGGVDSLAAGLVMPDEFLGVFLDRIQVDSTSSSLYKSEAALSAVDAMRSFGWDVEVVRTDLEHVRSPVGFPWNLSHGWDASATVGLVLLANEKSLNSVGTGTIMESAYGLDHLVWRDYADCVHGMWNPVFEAVSLELFQPVVGVSEVGTSKIVRDAGLDDVASPCVRGTLGQSCMRCVKCFRKSLLQGALTGNWPTEVDLEQFRSSRSVVSALASPLVHHYGVYAWALERYSGKSPSLLELNSRLFRIPMAWSFLEAWNPDSSRTWPERYRRKALEKLNRYLDPYSSSQRMVPKELKLGLVGQLPMHDSWG